MPLARCPDCDELVAIQSTGRPKMPGFSAEWQRIAYHERAVIDDDPLSYRSRVVVERCEGSGKLV